jgi:hypothetical protein
MTMVRGVGDRVPLRPREFEGSMRQENKKAPSEIQDQSGACDIPFDACPFREFH